jgi:hypothetical protein
MIPSLSKYREQKQSPPGNTQNGARPGGVWWPIAAIRKFIKFLFIFIYIFNFYFFKFYLFIFILKIILFENKSM